MLTKNKISIIFIFFISIIPLFALFHPGLPITHDGQDHVARIANFYQNLEDGNIIPRWASNLNWRYGHPILMFLYPLSSYSASFFHFLGFSLVDSIKIIFGLAFIASGITMYLWVREMTDNKAGVVAATLYMFAPYRFVDLYVRGAIGEHVAFVFPPLILYFILKLSKKRSYGSLIGGSLSLAGLLLSHNAVSLIFIPIIFLYITYLYWQSKSRNYFLLYSLYLILIGFSLSAFFWFPAFFEGKYTLRDIVTKGSYAKNFVDLKNFIYSEWNYGISGQFSVQVGIVQWALTILSIPVSLYLFKKRNKMWVLSLVLFLIFWIVLFLMIPNSQFIWQEITLIQKFQFPWRLLSIIVFVTSLLGGIFLSVIPKKSQCLTTIFLVIAVLFLSRDYWKPQGYLYKPESFYTGVYDSTTDTGESGPIWSVRFMEKRPRAYLEVIEGKAEIKEIKRTSTIHSYQIIADRLTRLRENTLYFPGWEVYVDGKKSNIEFQDPANRGLMTFYVLEGKHFLEIRFQETKLRMLADLISVLSFLFIFVYAILERKIWKQFQ